MPIWNAERPLARVRLAPGVQHIVSAIALRLGKKGAVPHGLDDNEHDVEQNGDDGEQQRLDRRLARVGLGLGVVRDDQREHGKRGDDHEEGPRAGEIVFLLPVAERAHDQRRADHAVEHDHQRGEHGVARKRRVVLAMQHDRGEQRNLDHDHRQGKHERAVRLAEFLRDRFGMAHDTEGAPHHGAEQPEEQQDGERVIMQVGKQLAAEEMGDQDAYDGGRGRGDLLEKSARTPRCGECRLERFALVHQAPVSPRPESTIRKSGHPLSDARVKASDHV